MLLPRLVALVVIWLLAAASWTLAAGGPATPEATAPAAGDEGKPEVLVVPDVRGQAYVFAKGILQDAGFAWRVQGPVKGFAANTVAAQNPAPGVKVVDNGAPTVAIRLSRNAKYHEQGLPENVAPYKGSAVVLLKDWNAAHAQPGPDTETAPTETAPTETAPTETAPAETAPTETAPPAETAPAPTTTAPEQPAAPASRKPDFVAPGAPPEPAGEMPLPRRARMLQQRVARIARPNPRFVDSWLYQHSWIVTGATFGWHDGDDALRILIGVDRNLQKRFGFGAKSERVATRALAYVENRKR
jgi:hypothetical protein